MKILQFRRSPIVKGIKKLKEIRNGIWRNRIDSAQNYEDQPICDKCGSYVVKLKYKFKLNKDLFHVTCKLCGHTWYAKRKIHKEQIAEHLMWEAEGKGLKVSDWLEIKQIRDAKLAKLGIEVDDSHLKYFNRY